MGKELFAYANDMKYTVRKTHGRHSTLIATEEDMGSKGVAISRVTMDPGGQTTEHIHEFQQEAMFFYEGTGTAVINGKEFEIRPESLMLAPPKVKHNILNTGSGPLKFVTIFCPPMPEQISREEYFKRAKDQIEER